MFITEFDIIKYSCNNLLNNNGKKGEINTIKNRKKFYLTKILTSGLLLLLLDSIQITVQYIKDNNLN